MTKKKYPLAEAFAGDKQALAVVLKAFREKHGVSLRYMAGELPVPLRTLEGVEQGRGFRYAPLLLISMADMITTETMGIGPWHQRLGL